VWLPTLPALPLPLLLLLLVSLVLLLLLLCYLLLLLLLQGSVWGSGMAAVGCAALAMLTGEHAVWQVRVPQ
jgi:hypothetical protein